MLRHKGHVGSAEYSVEDEVFHGQLLGIRALVTYESDGAKELKPAFVEAVEAYLDTCQSEGIPPEKPYKGVFNVRTSPTIHRRLAAYAKAHGVKLNTLINEALERYLEGQGEQRP